MNPSTEPADLLRAAAAVVALAGLATAGLAFLGVRVARPVVLAVTRASVQLALVGAVLGAVFRAPVGVLGVLAVMLVTASTTAAARLVELPLPRQRRVAAVAGAAVTGAGLAAAVVFGTGALGFDARNVVAVGGILLGGTMTACTLAGRRLIAEVRSRRAEVEGWLALGATMQEATREQVRVAAREALVPALDQTRTVGLVTLPGAFVGALLGGASAGEAARFQLLVLAGLLAAEGVAVAVLLRRLGDLPVLPEPG